MKDNFEISDLSARDGSHASRGCERAQDVVAYLYGEAPPDEARSFTAHLEACAACREELAAFKNVRMQMSALRAEALQAGPGVSVAEAFADAIRLADKPARKRSALAALREFFSLSPMWLQFGSATAALVVCALAAFAYARTEIRWDGQGLAIRSGAMSETVEKRVEVPTPGMYTEQQLNEIAEERARKALEEYRASAPEAEALQTASVEAPERKSRAVAIPVRSDARRSEAQVAVEPKAKRNVRGNLEYEPQDDELPGLYDLLSEAR